MYEKKLSNTKMLVLKTGKIADLCVQNSIRARTEYFDKMTGPFIGFNYSIRYFTCT